MSSRGAVRAALWMLTAALLFGLSACTPSSVSLDQRARALLQDLIQTPQDSTALEKAAGLPADQLQRIIQERNLRLSLEYLNARHRQGLSLRVDVNRRLADKPGRQRRVSLVVYEKEPGSDQAVPRYRYEMVFVRAAEAADWQLSSLREQVSGQ